MYGGKNTLIVASVDRREACRHDVILSKNAFFDSLNPLALSRGVFVCGCKTARPRGRGFVRTGSAYKNVL